MFLSVEILSHAGHSISKSTIPWQLDVLEDVLHHIRLINALVIVALICTTRS